MTTKRRAILVMRARRLVGSRGNSSCTSGLVRLPDGSVERQTWAIDWGGRHVIHRECVSQAYLDSFKVIGFLEDRLGSKEA